jgi:hypothetical protein
MIKTVAAKLILYISLIGTSWIFASEKKFLTLCQESQKNNSTFSKDILHTISVLLQEAGTNNCKIAYKTLKKSTNLYLRAKNISDLTPLSYFDNFTTIDLRDNKIESLWGIETNTDLTLLNVENNNIDNIIALSYTKNLLVVDLSSNKIKNVTPIKDLSFLYKVNIDNNPISNDEEKMDYLNSILMLRQLNQNGLIQDFGESLQEASYLLEQAAIREDLYYFRILFKISYIKTIFISPIFFETFNIKTRRVITALNESEATADRITKHYLKKINPNLIKSNFYLELKDKLSKTLLYFITGEDLSPNNKNDLHVLEEKIKQHIDQNHNFKLTPQTLYSILNKIMIEHQEYGLPLSYKTGFNLS